MSLISNLLTKYIRLSNWILTSCQLHLVSYGWWILATIHRTWVKTMCTMSTYHSKLPLEMMMHTARVTKRVPAWERGGWEVNICSKYFISSSEYLQWERSQCYAFNVTLSPQRFWPEQQSHVFGRCPAEKLSAFGPCVSDWSAFDTYISNLSAFETCVSNLSAFDTHVSNGSAFNTHVSIGHHLTLMFQICQHSAASSMQDKPKGGLHFPFYRTPPPVIFFSLPQFRVCWVFLQNSRT